MTDPTPATDEILNLWPTLFGHKSLPGHAPHDEALLALAGAADADPLGTGHSSGAWLRSHVETSVREWLEAAHGADRFEWRVEGRLESLGFCDYRDLANEPGAYLAGVYFVNRPAKPEVAPIRSDCDPSCVSFFDSRIGFNATAIPGDPYYSQTFSVLPEPGMLMLWPAYVRHFLRVHLSHRPWVLVRLRVELDSIDRPGGVQ